MAEEVIETPETPDTSTEAAPVEETPPTPVNYEERYNSLRPEFDRRNQRLSEFEALLNDPNALAARLQELAPEQDPPDDDDEYLYEDPVARQRLAELEARLERNEKAEQADRERGETSAHITSELESLEEEFDDELNQKESDWIGNFALANRDENGKPDVRLAYQTYTELIDGRNAKYVQGKKSPQVKSGPGAAKTVNLDDPREREDYITRRLAEMESPV